MAKSAAAVARKTWRQISRQIFRQDRTLTLPVPAHPRGQESGAVLGMFEPPPESQRVLLDKLTEDILSWLPEEMDCRARGARVIAKLRDLVGDLPASADHHHSERYGLLQHSLEVALKMLEEFEKTLLPDAPPDVALFNPEADPLQTQYLYFLAGLGHDLGKLLDMDVWAGGQRWSPLNQTYAEFVRQVKVEPVLRWNEKRVRGGHAQFSVWLMHYLLGPADIRFIGLARLPELMAALAGTHTADQATPLACLVSQADQQSVEQAAPDWMLKREDSKVSQFIRALRDLISGGRLKVNSRGAPVYVTGDRAAAIIPRSLSTARHHLKERKITLPSNHHLYDLLAQAKVVEADENGQCVKRIRVPGKRGPVELYALIFGTNTIIPEYILPTLPTITFEVVPEEPKQPNVKASGSTKPSPVEEPEAETTASSQTAAGTP
jgi:Putative helicase